MEFARPDTLETALSLLSAGDWTILSGGTDFFPALGGNQVEGPVLDISALSELRGISKQGGAWRIGALATWTDVIRETLPPAFDGLKQAAREVGSVQIQNSATVAGNICNASPAADGVPPLLTLNATVELLSGSRKREIALSDFITGNRSTKLRPGELVSAILVPNEATTGRSSFLKLGARKYLVISIAMVAVRIATDNRGKITDAAVSVGACSAVAQRLPELEAALVGWPVSDDLTTCVDKEQFRALSPIDDVRATAAYRVETAVELARRAITQAAREAPI